MMGSPIQPRSALSGFLRVPLPDSFAISPFERLQFWETQSGSPNQIVAVLDLKGQLNPELLLDALHKVIARHPLLTSVLKTKNERPLHWQVTDLRSLQANFHPVADDAAPLAGDTLPPLPPMQLTDGIGVRFNVWHSPSRCRWILQTHHANCDGVSGIQLIRELLKVYHWLCQQSNDAQSNDAQSDSPFPLRPLQPERLLNRGRWVRWDWYSLWKLPIQLIGLFGATKFLLRSPVQLTAATSLSSQPDPSKSLPNHSLSADSNSSKPAGKDTTSNHANTVTDDATSDPTLQLACQHAQLSLSQTKRLRDLSRGWNVTVNSLLLSHWLIALDHLRQDQQRVGQRDWYRLMIPVNQRQASDISLPACNRVSIVYIDRRTSELGFPERLTEGINFEMHVMRRFGLTRTFLFALDVFAWVPGLFRLHCRRKNCWATSYVTNLGPALDRLQTPVDETGQAKVGGLTLESVRLLPPLRHGTPIALAVCQYAKRLSFTVHYRPEVISQKQAESTLNRFLNRLRTL